MVSIESGKQKLNQTQFDNRGAKKKQLEKLQYGTSRDKALSIALQDVQ